MTETDPQPGAGTRITDAEIADFVGRDARRQRRRARLGVLRLLAARYLYVPWRCEVCGCLVSARRLGRHAKWHHWQAMTAWVAGGGRGPKPKRAPLPPRFLGRSS
ncbi:hypothetical protein GCM10023201_41180 [Actinomycetospora corticicola]|uniref:Uncharacterized protein n=1 Tax=Actinomycetospora corticicola TaxID=663602 RepID=A0A7Y9DWN0_9PSEU|nr:hypothetical protein [Actinomycetospora corticicola]NYD36795.1 hypothetical protein [Actinomycetospora corticicola]